MSAATATRPAAAWRRTSLASGAWRLEHRPTRSVVFVARTATEVEVQPGWPRPRP